ncbi:MAG: NAD-dependent dehydratase [Proteobacteria bacterium]|nr:NAD-dependent dehydratase [Pseudomonadota bacterium]
MRVFLTGATGFIGSHIVPELLAAGHEVLGMTRSERGAEALKAAGATVHHAALEDLDSIRAGAAQADAVIHTAFDHDFSRFVENCEKERRIIGALGEELKGSNRPLIITSGVGIGEQEHGAPAIETVFNTAHRKPAHRLRRGRKRRAGSRRGCARHVASPGARRRQARPHQPVCRHLPGEGRCRLCRRRRHRYSAAHVGDVAKLYALALDKGRHGERYNAVAEEGVPMRRIAEVIGAGLGLPVKSVTPEEAKAHFGWFAMFAGFDLPALSDLTRQPLGWTPVGPGLIEDLQRMNYAVPA